MGLGRKGGGESRVQQQEEGGEDPVVHGSFVAALAADPADAVPMGIPDTA